LIDHIRLRQDAEYVIENYSGSPAGRVALDLLRIIENPVLACPDGYALVKKPELLGLGVAQR
jgi:hypothetical protein